MWDVKTILEDFVKTKNLQEFINNRFKDDFRFVVSQKSCKYIGGDDAVFFFDDMVATIEQVDTDYSLEDLRINDIVLDIGACIGAFSLKVCKKVSRVFAVEPILIERLKQNIDLNNVKNIAVLDCALGDGEQELEWGNKTRKINCLSLSEIIKLCGGHIDFLKCDCEGGEWFITVEDLKGIRRIEIEVHNFDGKHDFDAFLKTLSDAGYVYKYKKLNKQQALIHARIAIGFEGDK